MNKNLKSISVVICFYGHSLLVSESNTVSRLNTSLELAGDNRSELDAALRAMPGEDTEYLISHASQYDLVNLTSNQITENITYARKVHVVLPYLPGMLPTEMWREWVLPHRVLDEGLCLWRKNLYENMQHLVEGKNNVGEVVEAIHGWLMVGGAYDSPRIVFGNSESRNKSPLQMLEIREGSCGELSAMMVYLLRTVGIPARHCLMNWRFGGNQLHYYCEYWDPQMQGWIPLDASDDKAFQNPLVRHKESMRSRLGSLSFHAHPGFPEVRDSYHTACFEQCLLVTENIANVNEVNFGSLPGFATTAYVWNTDAWRATAHDNGRGKNNAIQLSDAHESHNRPVLFTATNGETIMWGFQRPSAKNNKVKLVEAVFGECLRWEIYSKP